MTELIMPLLVAVLASNGLWTLVLRLYDSHKKAKTPQEKMILAIGRDRLLFLSQKYEKLGLIPEEEYENYKAMGEAYIEMGGNSRVKRHYESDMATLPMK